MTSGLFTSSELDDAYERARLWITASRRKGETRLVTAGHILAPPFTVSRVNKGGYFELTISGSTGKFTIDCNEVIASQFRTGQLDLLLFDSERVLQRRRTVAALTEGYWKILQAFPPGTRFSTEELYAKVTKKSGESQAHARRRWKELKYNYGFDVDFDRSANEYVRGSSNAPIKDPELRPDDKKLRDAFLSDLAEESRKKHADTLPHCNRCGARVIFPTGGIEEDGFDDMGLLDHRRPVFQGGGDEITNLQIFCQTDNNKKNSVCRNCPYGFKCDTCVWWAFPEQASSRRLVLVLEQETIDSLRKRFGDDLESELPEIIKRIVDDD